MIRSDPGVGLKSLQGIVKEDVPLAKGGDARIDVLEKGFDPVFDPLVEAFRFVSNGVWPPPEQQTFLVRSEETVWKEREKKILPQLCVESLSESVLRLFCRENQRSSSPNTKEKESKGEEKNRLGVPSI